MQHVIFILFLFALGACVGSFLNVVVWRLPQIELDPNDRSIFGPMLRTIDQLSNPPSHCPKCGKRLKWYDNIPVIGWLKLGGKCRFCKEPISPRYPIVEATCGLLFVFYYVMFFMAQVGPCAVRPSLVPSTTLGASMMVPRPLMLAIDWPMYALLMALVAGLLASSLIDAELFIIPVEIPWVLTGLGILVHTLIDRASLPGALNANAGTAAMAIGGAIGLIISILLWQRGIIPHSFPDGEPMQDAPEEPPPEPDAQSRRQMRNQFIFLLTLILLVATWLFTTESFPIALGVTIGLLIVLGLWAVRQYPLSSYDGRPLEDAQPQEGPVKTWKRRDMNREMRKEMMFLLPPMLVAAALWFVTNNVHPVQQWWNGLVSQNWFSGLSGALLGALAGAFVIWITRILGTLAFGRLAMGLGDVHLMFGVGAIIGAGAATATFFIAPFFTVVVAIYRLIFRKGREIPFGPYLSMAAATMLLFSCPILAYVRPGMMGLSLLVQEFLHGGGTEGM